MKRDCPNKDKAVEETPKSGLSRKVNRCVSDEMQSEVPVGCQLVQSLSYSGQQPTISPILPASTACNNSCDLICEVNNDVGDADMVTFGQDDNTVDIACVQLSKQIDVNTVNVFEANHVSKLNYVKVGIASKFDGENTYQ